MVSIKGVVVVLFKDPSNYGELFFSLDLPPASCSSCNPLDLGLRCHKDLIKRVVLVLLKGLAVTDTEEVKNSI